jgi:hypothetical protein
MLERRKSMYVIAYACCNVHILVRMVKDAFQKCHRGLSTSGGPAASMSANPLSPPYISSVMGSDDVLGLRCLNA